MRLGAKLGKWEYWRLLLLPRPQVLDKRHRLQPMQHELLSHKCPLYSRSSNMRLVPEGLDEHAQCFGYVHHFRYICVHGDSRGLCVHVCYQLLPYEHDSWSPDLRPVPGRLY
jgi:hypothetical protein